jgi:hypothetical protein
MANPYAIFGSIAEITRDERGGTVVLADGQNARFDPAEGRAAAFASILEDLRRRKMPVYIETDPASGFIRRVYLPKLVRVESITETPQGFSVTFEQSHARHVLKRDNADSGELLRALREAGKERWLAVTVTDAGEILDVRPFDPPYELPRLEPPPLRAGWWTWFWWPWNWFCCVSRKRAQQLFDLCAATTCNPLSVPPPCIPFLYPDDGCWGRAHEMCRLMINDGASPRKVWIYGWLHTLTKNNPNCFVDWGWHVAPTLCVWKCWWWPFSSEEQVIDPSLFTTPVSRETWKSVQGDANATFVSTPAGVFSRWSGDQPDPGYVQTNIVLANHRTLLQLRSLGPDGPPPYANCP